jgi:hypothetical protein
MSSEAIDLLRSIDASLKQLVARAQRSGPKPVADARDLDGKWGDPILRFDPRDWHGPSCKGRKLSECPPDLLDLAAESFEWFASQAEAKNELTDSGKPTAPFKRKDAARARGWAKRLRDGWTPPQVIDETWAREHEAGDDDVGF